MTQAQANVYRRRFGLGERHPLETRLRRLAQALRALAADPMA